MTCIVYDGKNTLAGDNQMTSWGVPMKIKKVSKVNGYLTGLMGGANTGIDILEWFRAGAVAKDFPKTAQSATGDDVGFLIVICEKKGALLYSKSPNPLPYGKQSFAWGSGMDLAIGAMESGKTASQAVKIAISKNTGCGFGITTISFAKPKKKKPVKS